MTDIDEVIRTYLFAIEIEGKSPRTIARYANSLEDFRQGGRRRRGLCSMSLPRGRAVRMPHEVPSSAWRVP
jgi:hypothetical protein